MSMLAEDRKEIIFNTKRAGYFSIIALIILCVLIGIICYIELSLKKINNGLSNDLETLSPIFYGIVSLFIAIFYAFVYYYIAITIIKYKNDIQSINHLKIIYVLSFILPTLFCFIAIWKINHSNSSLTKNKKIFKKRKKIPYSLIELPNVAYQDKNGKWWYKDEQNNFYYANENNEWVKV